MGLTALRAACSETWHDPSVSRPRVHVLAVTGLLLACTEPERSPPPPGSGSPSGGVGGGSGAGGGPDEPDDPTDPGDPPMRECDPWANHGTECGADGVCSFVDMQCHDATGTAGQDQPCELVDAELWLGTCAPGLVCVVDVDTFGRCARPCDEELDCDDPQRCRLPAGLSPTQVCVLPCDPFVQDCLPDEGCYVVQPDDPAPLCALAGAGVESDPCTASTDCAPGHHCTPPQSHMVECASPVGCCTPLCDIELNDCVALNPICAPLAVPDVPTLGVCVGDV